MTTISATVTRSALADAWSAARQLRTRLSTVAAGSDDQRAANDMKALATVLESAASDYAAGESWAHDRVPYVLELHTNGDHDATTKTVIREWLYGTANAPACGLQHGGTKLAPRLGDALETLADQL